MNKPIGLGFIGCGKHAFRSHAQVASQMPEEFSLQAAFDINRSAAQQVADLATGVHIYTSAEDLFQDSLVEAVVIATPHQFHLELCEQAIKTGKHVLCEKPLWEGEHTKRGVAVLEEAARRGLVFSSCHPRRFEPEYNSLRNDLDWHRKQFGNPTEFVFRFFYHEPSTAWKLEDSLLLDHMNHEIDLANFILGHSGVHLVRVSDGYDHYLVTGTRDDGIHLHFSGYRRLAEHVFRNEMELIFERGRVVTHSTLVDGVVNGEMLFEDFSTNKTVRTDLLPRSYIDVFCGVMQNFGKAIRGKADVYLTPRDLMVNTISCNTLVASGEYRD